MLKGFNEKNYAFPSAKIIFKILSNFIHQFLAKIRENFHKNSSKKPGVSINFLAKGKFSRFIFNNPVVFIDFKLNIKFEKV